MTEIPCQSLDWDSEFFGRRIARITTNRLRRETLERVLAWCEARSIECAYFLASADDDTTVRLAEDHGFQLVDLRVTLERSLAGATGDGTPGEAMTTRLARSDDVPVLRAIARVNHRDTRFYHDANFPRERCDALYETWIERSCGGYADAVWVCERARRPVGYVSCHRVGERAGQIGLLGVDPAVHGAGVGRRLVAAALDWFADLGAERVSVVTQGRNVRGQRLYQRAGFVTASLELLYHRWFVTRDGGGGP